MGDPMTSGHSDELGALCSAIEPLAGRVRPEPIHWVHGDDDGSDYCGRCARKKVRALRASGDDVEVDGGWEDERASDGPSFCGGCGTMLGYRLRQEALRQEMSHFVSEPLSSPVTPSTAYQVLAVMWAARWSHDSTLQEACVAIGRQAVEAMGKAARKRLRSALGPPDAREASHQPAQEATA